MKASLTPRCMVGTLVVGALLLLSCQGAAPAAPATSAPAAPTKAPAAPAAPTAAAPAAAPTAAQAPAAPTAPPEVLKIGLQTSLTGAAARAGLNVERYIRFGLDDINAKGGLKVGNKTYRVEAITADDKGTSEGARETANRLVLAEKVKHILGTITTPTAGAQTVTEPAKVLLVANAATDKSLGTAFPLTMQAGVAHNIMRAGAIYDWLVRDHPQVKRIAITTTDDSGGRAIADVVETMAKAKGISITAKEFYPVDIKDFSPLITRLLRDKPDGIDSFAGGRANLFLGMMEELSQQGYQGLVFGVSAEGSVMAQGASFIKSFTAATMVDRKADVITSGEKAVIQRSVDKYGEADTEPYLVCAYNIPILWAQAVEKAGTIDDTVKIAQVMRDGEWEGVWSKEFGKAKWVGAKTFGLPAVIEQPIYLSKVEGGKVSTFTSLKGSLP